MRCPSTLPCFSASACLLLGTLIASAGPAQNPETGLSGQVVTADQNGGSPSLIDLATGAVTTVTVARGSNLVSVTDTVTESVVMIPVGDGPQG